MERYSKNGILNVREHYTWASHARIYSRLIKKLLTNGRASKKISYYMQPGKDRISKIHSRLLHQKCRYDLIYSHNEFLDILPYRASKGTAIRYLSYKWEIPHISYMPKDIFDPG